MIKSAQGSPAPSFCGKARAPTNHGRRKNFRPRIFAQLSRDLPIFSNFGSNFRRKQNPFHPSFYSIAALPRAPTARTLAHRFAPHTRLHNITNSHRPNRQCNSPPPAQPHEQQPRDRPHSRFHERHLFRPPFSALALSHVCPVPRAALPRSRTNTAPFCAQSHSLSAQAFTVQRHILCLPVPHRNTPPLATPHSSQLGRSRSDLFPAPAATLFRFSFCALSPRHFDRQTKDAR